MKYLLDTDLVIDHIRGKKYLDKQFFYAGCGISIITLGELLCGAYKSRSSKDGLQRINDFLGLGVTVKELDIKVIDIYAEYRAELETSGQRLDEFDLLIASTAIINNLTLITRNLSHFKRIKNLKLA